MFNQYGVILVNPNQASAWEEGTRQQFISPEGQRAITNYKIKGEQLLFPNASDPNARTECDVSPWFAMSFRCRELLTLFRMATPGLNVTFTCHVKIRPFHSCCGPIASSRQAMPQRERW